jgi:1,2-dihydroxy-3-keto-5-methylthiopentene dioxygenase
MSELFIPSQEFRTEDFNEIKQQLRARGITFNRWSAAIPLSINDSEATILKAFEHEIKPFMEASGFMSADVINVHPQMENLEQLRAKFLSEHTHSEDEVRFFVDGCGKFWFHFDDGVVACVKCTKGDFLSVPTGFKHWFDLAPEYFVKAIRIFTSKDGWVAKYTESGIDTEYQL